MANNLNDLAYQRIKEDILSCALQPGDEISESLLVARYAMSKAPVRSALTRLRQEGLIVARGRQTAVAAITLSDVQEIFQLRLVLEVTAVKLAAGRVDPERLRSLNDAVHAHHHKDSDSDSDSADAAAYLRANRAFHQYIAEASGNRRLAGLVVDLMEQHERIVHLGLALQQREQEFVHFHDDLVDALIAGDAARAAELAEDALRGSQRKVVETLLGVLDAVSVAGVDLRP